MQKPTAAPNPVPPPQDSLDSAAPAPDPDGPDDLPPRRRIDPQVLAVLRAEAERETSARRKETAAPQDGPPPDRAGERIRDRLARLKAAEAVAPEEDQWQTGEESPPRRPPARKDSTAPAKPLIDHPTQPAPASPSSSPSPTSATPNPTTGRALTPRSQPGLPVRLSPLELAVIAEKRQRTGFRIGFAATAGLCCLLLTLVASAPRIITHLPATSPLLTPLVTTSEMAQHRIVGTVHAALAAFGGGEK
ncbi:MAG: hypothetical protein ACK5IB_10360 [Qingshengfaniella sp.]